LKLTLVANCIKQKLAAHASINENKIIYRTLKIDLCDRGNKIYKRA
jgi:hypothetical protein